MKVLITHELFMPDFHGGGEMIAYELAKGLLEKGVDVEVLTTGDPGIKEFDGIKTTRMSINRYLMNLAAPIVWKHAKSCDIIQTLNYNACFPSWTAGKLMKKPVVCIVTGLYGKRWMKMRGPVLGNLSKWVERFQINRSYDRILFLSEFSRQIGIGAGIPKELTDVVNPGIDHKKFKAKRKNFFVLFMGRFAKQKGVYNLIEVAKQLSDVNFKLVGKGEEEEKLKSIAPKNVEFLNLNFKSGKPFYDLYSRAAIFCLPSIAETFGLVIVEAMASGCAIISTVPLDYEGIRIEAGNNKRLADAIRHLIENPRKTLRMGRTNIEKSKKYNWDDFIKKVMKIYEEVLS